jgi:signal transduction histidine kinase
MGRLIDDLLDFASLEAGRLSLAPTTQAAAPLVHDACQLFADIARDKGLRLACETGADLPPVPCDRDRVLQVLANLLDNAVKATPAGGAVVVRAEARPGEVCFSVADTGPGMPAEELPHLFERFRRGRQAGYRGTGLGLAIARGIVSAHGGRIWADSAPGRGSTFWFTLPAA